MYVCICNSVTESDIRKAVAQGVRDMRQLERITDCSSECGQCREMAQEVFAAALAEHKPVLRIVSSRDIV